MTARMACLLGILACGALARAAPAAPPAAPAGDAAQARIDDERALERAMQAIDREAYGEAIAILERLVERNPGMHAAWEHLGWAFWQSGQRQRAFALWQQLARLNPNLPQAHALLAMVHAAEGRLPDAIAAYSRSLDLDPNQPAARFALARLHYWSGHLPEARKALDALYRAAPDRADLGVELARVLFVGGDYAGALALWDVLLKDDPQNPEFRARRAAALLHANRRDEAVREAEALLRGHPDNITALTVLADAHECGAAPADARPFLRRLLAAAASGPLDTRQTLRARLIALEVRLQQTDPAAYPLEEAIRLAREAAQEEPTNSDHALLLAELLVDNRQYDLAEPVFRGVLRDLNPNNQRAFRGLFELYYARGDNRQAAEMVERLRAFNPRDPYHEYRLARLEDVRGRYRRARQAIDRLGEAGRRGAVPVLLYHGLTTSDWMPDRLSLRRFQDHLAAFAQAGYRFLTPDALPGVVAGQTPPYPSAFPSNRAVVVTFDDARRDALELAASSNATPDAVFTMHVPVGNLLRGDAVLADWTLLRRCAAGGRWRFGSQLLDASIRQPVNTNGVLGYPQANRLWRADAGRLDTAAEFEARVAAEYARSRAILEERLGPAALAPCVAYVAGDIGQQTESNASNAPAVNLAAAGTTYALGFLQSSFGYAVNGDDPLRYQRLAVGPMTAASNLLEQVIRNHPAYLAERLRAEFAARRGKAHAAQDALDRLAQSGYPSNALREVAAYVKDHAASRFAIPTDAAHREKGHAELALTRPFVGGRAEYYRDSLSTRNGRLLGAGGLDLTPRLTLEAEAGWGRLEQDGAVTSAAPGTAGGSATQQYRIEEEDIGLGASYLVTKRWLMNGRLQQRRFGAPADRSEMAGALEAQMRPWLHLDLMGRYEHDAVPAAAAVVDGVTYDLGGLMGDWHITDWWSLQGNVLQYWYSDRNDRFHVNAETLLLVAEPIGLHLGLRYGYAHAPEERTIYWTPCELNRYYLCAALRQSVGRVFYNLQARLGVGQEGLRPEEEQTYQAKVQRYRDLAARARRERWPQRAIDDAQGLLAEVLADAPDNGWVPIVALSASTRIKLAPHWDLSGEIAYNRLPDYDETRAHAGVKWYF